MKRFILSVSLIAFTSTIVGCGSQSAREPVTLRSQTDIQLAPEDQAKQSALGRLLRAFQEGAHDESDLEVLAGGIQFPEGIAGFYGSKKRLYRWEFKGAPQGDAVTVVLVLDEKESGPLDTTTESREERTYTVTSSYGQFLIERTK